MSDANAYIANAGEVRGAAMVLNEIEKAARQMVVEFQAGVSETVGWEGKDDNYARMTKKVVAEQESASMATVKAVADAVAGVANGSVANAQNILRTQEANLQAIQKSGPAGGTASSKLDRLGWSAPSD
ncbi:hypothetical protein [Streptomyces sp. NPDC002540]